MLKLLKPLCRLATRSTEGLMTRAMHDFVCISNSANLKSSGELESHQQISNFFFGTGLSSCIELNLMQLLTDLLTGNSMTVDLEIPQIFKNITARLSVTDLYL